MYRLITGGQGQVAERLEDLQETVASRGLIPVRICLLSWQTERLQNECYCYWQPL